MKLLIFPRLLTSAFFFVLLFSTIAINAQTSAFTYQGRLMDGSLPANGTYHMQFKLFGSMVGDDQIGQTLVFDGTNAATVIYVVDGVFTAKLDFGVEAFKTTADRFLEISIKKPSEQAYGTIMPRQLITSVPYSVRALSAATADNFNGNLAGDVTGAQSATVVEKVGGQTAANVAAATTAAKNATSSNSPNQIVKRDANGNFSAGTITADLNGNASSATNATNANNATNAGTANNALNLGGTAANQYVLTSDSRLTNARTPTGAAGGGLTGSYPNPMIAENAVGGAQILDGSLGMNDIFVYVGAGTISNEVTIQGNSCANLSGTAGFDLLEDDIIMISIKNKPFGLMTDNVTVNGSDAAINNMSFQVCNITNVDLTIPAGSAARLMFLRPGSGTSAMPNANSPASRDSKLSSPVILKLNPNERLNSQNEKAARPKNRINE